MNVQPAAVFEAVIDTGETGIVDVLTVEVSDNTVGGALATASAIVEIAPGVYAASGLTAPDTQGQYTLIWRGSGGTVLGIEDLVVTSSAPGDPVPPADTYATADELFRRLKIRTPTADQTEAAERVLGAAAGEINARMARTTGLANWELLYVEEINLQRAEELWNQGEVPFGAIGLDNPSGPVFLPRRSAALAKLNILQQGWGVA